MSRAPRPARTARDGAARADTARTVGAALDRAVAGLGLDDPPPALPVRLRRARRSGPGRGLYELALVERDGVLDWIVRPGGAGAARRRRARRAGPGQAPADIRTYPFAELAPSDVVKLLDALDAKLTPRQRLRRWDGAALRDFDGAVDGPDALLFVHGTFSSGDAFFRELQSHAPGRDFLGRAAARYRHVLAFDHPTLAVSPVLNALDLARRLEGSPARLDVVCHSRGGLVTRWWLQGFGGAARTDRAVFVAAPLAGTSLASPARLRESLRFLTNVGGALAQAAGMAAAAAPFLAIPAALMKVVASVAGGLAATPALDAAIAMVPGLAAMSRVGNNPEIGRLRRLGDADLPECWAVRADFEPRDPGWRFWERFVRIGARAADWGADLVFGGPNDLVVDTVAMASLDDRVEIPRERVLDFPRGERVHHCNYFAQRETVEHLERALRVGAGAAGARPRAGRASARARRSGASRSRPAR